MPLPRPSCGVVTYTSYLISKISGDTRWELCKPISEKIQDTSRENRWRDHLDLPTRLFGLGVEETFIYLWREPDCWNRFTSHPTFGSNPVFRVYNHQHVLFSVTRSGLIHFNCCFPRFSNAVTSLMGIKPKLYCVVNYRSGHHLISVCK